MRLSQLRITRQPGAESVDEMEASVGSVGIRRPRIWLSALQARLVQVLVAVVPESVVSVHLLELEEVSFKNSIQIVMLNVSID